MNTSQVVPINDMPRELRDRLPGTYRALLDETGCEFDKSGHWFVRDGRVVLGYGEARDCSRLDELQAAISLVR